MNIEEKIKQVISKLENASNDAIKASSGNVSAGRRVRKIALEATKELKELRSLILEINKKDKD
jgi:hypothetical protein|tara:strand:+ start:391 stop:579 length:189 start_codon:yes stop_codon:yes gene_type:complete